MKIIAFGGVVLLLLAVAKGLFPSTLIYLPLGGSTISEIGIVFGISVALATISTVGRSKNE